MASIAAVAGKGVLLRCPASVAALTSLRAVASGPARLAKKSSDGGKAKVTRPDQSKPEAGSKPARGSLADVVKPVLVDGHNPNEIAAGEELVGEISKDAVLNLLNSFYRCPEAKQLASSRGLDGRLFHEAFISFRRFCVESPALPTDLHVVFSDVLQEAGHVMDVFPYFLKHAVRMFPHMECMDDLRKISDLRVPANWYPEARALQRKIIFHAGPTNSGKTHHAISRFLEAKSGLYCGPLKMLAVEICQRSNAAGVPCDLITGEERRLANPDGVTPSAHVACTVEMTSLTTNYEVAVLDEIQMLRDQGRGWAWTRALLGMCGEEVHVCGETAAIDLVRELALSTGDEVEVRRYKRLTRLVYESSAVESFDAVRDGDCIVCFSKNDIYHISRELEKRGKECVVVYGGLPPGTKLAQAQKFNDPSSSCKIMVATDAIGMGINLCIRRVIFYSLTKMTENAKGEREVDVISTSHALQIAGRAGRYGTQYETGYVTTFKAEDLPLLKDIVSRPVDVIDQAGLHPTAEQIELFAFHLPKATLSNLLDIFVTMSVLDGDRFFLCNIEPLKLLADIIEHVPLPLRVRYVFCCSPIPKQSPFVTTLFLKFARRYSSGQVLTFDWLGEQIGWPFTVPSTVAELVHLESVHDVLDLYQWLSYRFEDMFPDRNLVRDVQIELDRLISAGVANITRLLLASEEERESLRLEAAAASAAQGAAVRPAAGVPPAGSRGQAKYAATNTRSTTAAEPQKGSSRRADGKATLLPPDRSVELQDADLVRGMVRAGSADDTESYEVPATPSPSRTTILPQFRKALSEASKDRAATPGGTAGSGATPPAAAAFREVLARAGGSSRLSEALIQKGLLTREMLLQLQQEWSEASAARAGDGPVGGTASSKSNVDAGSGVPSPQVAPVRQPPGPGRRPHAPRGSSSTNWQLAGGGESSSSNAASPPAVTTLLEQLKKERKAARFSTGIKDEPVDKEAQPDAGNIDATSPSER